MEERDSVKWLHRRAGFGLPPAQMRAAIDRGFTAELDRLLNSDAIANAVASDPWDDDSLPYDPMDAPSRRYAIGRWVEAMIASEQPLVDRMAWLWHGHFVSALDKVRVARLLVDQIRLLRSAGLGDTRSLLRALTIDPAMAIYLDLRTSTDEVPNENYSRELLELFALGEGNYTEDDVQAGAAALSGWVLDRATGDLAFRPRRHDDQPQSFLGVEGVHDLDSVIDAVMAHPALAPFIAGTIAEELLGESESALVEELATDFASSGFVIADLVRAALTAGAQRAAAPLVLGPLPWLVIATRTTGARLDLAQAAVVLRAAGQLPMLPPNVAGWPGGAAWFNAGSLVARANLAALVAADATDEDVLAAVAGDDMDVLADVLGLPASGFDEQSRVALSDTPAGRDRLAVALITPEFMIA